MEAMHCLESKLGRAPSLPPGRPVELPGRGTTFVHEAPGRPGAPTLVLLHGLGATAALNWFTCFAALKGFHVVALDHRGHGRGVRGSRFTLEDAADDAVALADVLGIDRFVAVGYSMGGPIAQLIWRRHAPRVAGLVLCATSHRFCGTPQEQLAFATIPAIAQLSRFVPDVVGRRVLSAISSPYVSRQRFADWIRDQFQQQDRRSVLQAAAALGRYRADEWIHEIDVPTSVLVHRQDQLVPPMRQVELAGAIRGAVTRVVDGDHFSVVRDPQSFLPAFRAGVDDVVRAVAGAPLVRQAS